MNLYPTQFFRKTAVFLVLLLFCLWSCKKDDTTKPIDYGYTIAINSPSENGIYSVGDTLPISISYSSTTGEIVHYISVQIYNKYAESIFLYSVQSHQHVPDLFEYNDHFALKDTAKINTGEEWVLKAAMWTHEIDTDTIVVKRDLLIKK
jgi:hypothetical protein